MDRAAGQATVHGVTKSRTRLKRLSTDAREATQAPQVALVVKNPPGNAGDTREAVSIPGSGRCPGEGNGNPLQYSCLENPMDGGAWWATVHWIADADTTEHPAHITTSL